MTSHSLFWSRKLLWNIYQALEIDNAGAAGSEAAASWELAAMGGQGGSLAAVSMGRRLLSGSSLSTGGTIGYAFICVGLVIFAGMMAGLTLGLLSIDKSEAAAAPPPRRRTRLLLAVSSAAVGCPPCGSCLRTTPSPSLPPCSNSRMDLEVIKRSGTERERWLVRRIEPVVANTHYLLATLLLCNAAVSRQGAAAAGTARAPGSRWVQPSGSEQVLPRLNFLNSPCPCTPTHPQTPHPSPPPHTQPPRPGHGGPAHLPGPPAQPSGGHPHLRDGHPDLRRDPAAGGVQAPRPAGERPHPLRRGWSHSG